MPYIRAVSYASNWSKGGRERANKVGTKDDRGKIVKYFYAYECFKCRQRHALFQAAMRAPAPRTLDFTAEKLRLAFCRCDKKRGRRRRRRRKRKERKRYVKSTWVSIWKGKAAVECRTSLSFFLLFFFSFLRLRSHKKEALTLAGMHFSELSENEFSCSLQN